MLFKVGDNYWMQEEPEHPGEGDYVDAFVQNLELNESATMEASLCDDSNSWHLLPRNFKLKIICQLSSIPMTSHNEHSVSREEVYLDRGSLTWWLTNPSDELINFVWSVFAETEVIVKQICFQQHDRSVSWLILDKYAPHPFICLWQTYSVVENKVNQVRNQYIIKKENFKW